MEIETWIWIFAVCTFSASAQTEEEKIEKINSTDCWNYGKNRSIFESPGVQNFNDCGRWNQRGIPPWIVFLRTGGVFLGYGVLLYQTKQSSLTMGTIYTTRIKKGKKSKFMPANVKTKMMNRIASGKEVYRRIKRF